VRESGVRITIGQSVVRQLPMFLQLYWIDVHQRAFELLSKTRVVEADRANSHVTANSPRTAASS
jgi:hypothetical protein